MSFSNLGIKEEFVLALKKQNIISPTPVQSAVIKHLLDNKNVALQSKTGSGKTLAYLLPIINGIVETDNSLTAIIISPTHDLAGQIYTQINLLAKNSAKNIKSTLLLGGLNIKNQIESLKKKPQIIVGTPGRILDLIKQKKIPAHQVKTLVLDEADKLLDKNNKEQTISVVKTLMRRIQFVLASASILDSTITAASEFVTREQLEIITTNLLDKVPETISHYYSLCDYRKKIETVRKVINAKKYTKGIIFINNNDNIEEAVKKLQYHDIKCDIFYGNNRSEKRIQVIKDIKEGKINFLVATDIASRGLDIDDIEVVFSLSLSKDSYDYLHRVGRTGRQEKSGDSVLVIEQSELDLIKQYEKDLNITINAL